MLAASSEAAESSTVRRPASRTAPTRPRVMAEPRPARRSAAGRRSPSAPRRRPRGAALPPPATRRRRRTPPPSTRSPSRDQLAALADRTLDDLVAALEPRVDDVGDRGQVGSSRASTRTSGVGRHLGVRRAAPAVGTPSSSTGRRSPADRLADGRQQRRRGLVDPLEARGRPSSTWRSNSRRTSSAVNSVQPEPRPGVELPARALVGDEQGERADLLGRRPPVGARRRSSARCRRRRHESRPHSSTSAESLGD